MVPPRLLLWSRLNRERCVRFQASGAGFADAVQPLPDQRNFALGVETARFEVEPGGIRERVAERRDQVELNDAFAGEAGSERRGHGVEMLLRMGEDRLD